MKWGGFFPGDEQAAKAMIAEDKFVFKLEKFKQSVKEKEKEVATKPRR